MVGAAQCSSRKAASIYEVSGARHRCYNEARYFPCHASLEDRRRSRDKRSESPASEREEPPSRRPRHGDSNDARQDTFRDDLRSILIDTLRSIRDPPPASGPALTDAQPNALHPSDQVASRPGPTLSGQPNASST